MKVRLKRVVKDLPIPKYHTADAAGFDIYSRDTVDISAGELAVLPSNLVVETPKGYVLAMVARSSTFKKKGLMLPNSVGIVDADFRGDDDEILIQVLNLGKEAVKVEAGERIAQGIFLKFEQAEWEEVNKMNNINRGGIGSTG